MKNIKMIIFDLDGVLVDACDWHKIALNKALKNVSGYEISEEEHSLIFNGIPTKKKLEILNKRNNVDFSLNDEIFDKKQEYTIEAIKTFCKKDNTKIELIKELKSQGFIVCCFTNSISKTANLMLSLCGVIDMFDSIVTNENVLNPKPDPEGYSNICKIFNINPENVVIVEDSIKGKQAAYASGCNVIEVNNAVDVNLKLFKGILK
tara:strand:- start:499 stop:1116 length:618 start_codon:yes stop_codon:yes gene_type:complete